MIKHTIAIFFTLILLALIAAPSIIIAIDDSVDTSIFYSATEEEETSKIKLQWPNDFIDSERVIVFDNLETIEYFFKTYPKPHLNLIFPPPEFHIL
jgi:hypothetical protein